MDAQVVIETEDGWMIRCHCPKCQWHEFPKQPTAKGHRWTFNGDLVRPTFSPSMNEARNQPGPGHNPELESGRCHFTVTDGMILYHDDCSHGVRGKLHMIPWPPEKIAYYKSLKENGWR